MRPQVTEGDRRLARLADLDRARLERIGIAAATKIGFRAQQAALRAYRAGQHPGKAMRSELQAAAPLLVTGMAAGHLAGRRRTLLMAQETPKPVALSSKAYRDALKLLQKRLQLTPDQLKAIEAQYEAQALRVLATAEDAIEKKLQEAILEATASGFHKREGIKALQAAFDAAGLTPNNSFTLEAIFRTQTQVAYGAGRWSADQAPEIQEILWGYKYVTVGDDRVRSEHVGFEGVLLPKNDAFWSTHWPPNGWGCRCAVISIFEPSTAVYPPDKIEVDGRMVRPEVDQGFAYNPGLLFNDFLSHGA